MRINFIDWIYKNLMIHIYQHWLYTLLFVTMDLSKEYKKIINKILRPIVTNPRATVESTANVLEGKVR